MSDFDWPDVSSFQAKFGWERVKASKVILNYSKLSRFDKPFGDGLAPPCRDILVKAKHRVPRKTGSLSSIRKRCKIILSLMREPRFTPFFRL